MFKNKHLFLLLFFFALTGISSTSFTQTDGLIIQLQKDKSWKGVFSLEKINQTTPSLLSNQLNVYHLPSEDPEETKKWHQYLENHPAVLHLSYDQEVEFRIDPNDVHYERQWSLPRIQAPAVWDITRGGQTANGYEIVVAIIDSGFDIEHPDLAPNIWQSTADTPGDGLDNDQNGFVDDRTGWNFVNDKATYEADWHGQSVAGIIGAQGNNGLGVSGINWKVKLMLFSVRKVSHVIAAFNYILTQRKKYNESQGSEGSFVVAVNTSLGLNNAFCDSQPAWRDIYNVLGAEGVLSVASPPNSNIDVEVEGDIPTTCPSDFLLTTLRTDDEDQKHINSGYGTISIDLGAPGQNIYTTNLNDSYRNFSGTSASTPHLTGTIALLYSLPCPSLANLAQSDPASAALQIKTALLNGVDPISPLEAYTLTGGRLNIKNSADILMSSCESKEGAVSLLHIWPNPVEDYITISYQLESKQSGQLLIYNTLGQEVVRKNIIPTGEFTAQKRFPAPELSAGVYYMVLRTGKRMDVKGMVVR